MRSDGKSASLTAQNGEAQVGLLRAAMLQGALAHSCRLIQTFLSLLSPLLLVVVFRSSSSSDSSEEAS